MIRSFIRFSAPGASGYIPGTSKYKYRHDWIDIEWFAVLKPRWYGRVPEYVDFSHIVEKKTSKYLKAFATSGTMIDTVIIESAEIDGDGALSEFFRVTLERVLVENVSLPHADGGSAPIESVSLYAGKMTPKPLSYRPDAMKRAGLDSALGIRNGTRLA